MSENILPSSSKNDREIETKPKTIAITEKSEICVSDNQDLSASLNEEGLENTLQQNDEDATLAIQTITSTETRTMENINEAGERLCETETNENSSLSMPENSDSCKTNIEIASENVETEWQTSTVTENSDSCKITATVLSTSSNENNEVKDSSSTDKTTNMAAEIIDANIPEFINKIEIRSCDNEKQSPRSKPEKYQTNTDIIDILTQKDETKSEKFNMTDNSPSNEVTETKDEERPTESSSTVEEMGQEGNEVTINQRISQQNSEGTTKITLITHEEIRTKPVISMKVQLPLQKNVTSSNLQQEETNKISAGDIEQAIFGSVKYRHRYSKRKVSREDIEKKHERKREDVPHEPILQSDNSSAITSVEIAQDSASFNRSDSIVDQEVTGLDDILNVLERKGHLETISRPQSSKDVNAISVSDSITHIEGATNVNEFKKRTSTNEVSLENTEHNSSILQSQGDTQTKNEYAGLPIDSSTDIFDLLDDPFPILDEEENEISEEVEVPVIASAGAPSKVKEPSMTPNDSPIPTETSLADENHSKKEYDGLPIDSSSDIFDPPDDLVMISDGEENENDNVLEVEAPEREKETQSITDFLGNSSSATQTQIETSIVMTEEKETAEVPTDSCDVLIAEENIVPMEPKKEYSGLPNDSCSDIFDLVDEPIVLSEEESDCPEEFVSTEAIRGSQTEENASGDSLNVTILTDSSIDNTQSSSKVEYAGLPIDSCGIFDLLDDPVLVSEGDEDCPSFYGENIEKVEVTRNSERDVRTAISVNNQTSDSHDEIEICKNEQTDKTLRDGFSCIVVDGFESITMTSDSDGSISAETDFEIIMNHDIVSESPRKIDNIETKEFVIVEEENAAPEKTQKKKKKSVNFGTVDIITISPRNNQSEDSGTEDVFRVGECSGSQGENIEEDLLTREVEAESECSGLERIGTSPNQTESPHQDISELEDDSEHISTSDEKQIAEESLPTGADNRTINIEPESDELKSLSRKKPKKSKKSKKERKHNDVSEEVEDDNSIEYIDETKQSSSIEYSDIPESKTSTEELLTSIKNENVGVVEKQIEVDHNSENDELDQNIVSEAVHDFKNKIETKNLSLGEDQQSVRSTENENISRNSISISPFERQYLEQISSENVFKYNMRILEKKEIEFISNDSREETREGNIQNSAASNDAMMAETNSLKLTKKGENDNMPIIRLDEFSDLIKVVQKRLSELWENELLWHERKQRTREEERVFGKTDEELNKEKSSENNRGELSAPSKSDKQSSLLIKKEISTDKNRKEDSENNHISERCPIKNKGEKEKQHHMEKKEEFGECFRSNLNPDAAEFIPSFKKKTLKPISSASEKKEDKEPEIVNEIHENSASAWINQILEDSDNSLITPQNLISTTSFRNRNENTPFHSREPVSTYVEPNQMINRSSEMRYGEYDRIDREKPKKRNEKGKKLVASYIQQCRNIERDRIVVQQFLENERKRVESAINSPEQTQTLRALKNEYSRVLLDDSEKCDNSNQNKPISWANIVKSSKVSSSKASIEKEKDFTISKTNIEEASPSTNAVTKPELPDREVKNEEKPKTNDILGNEEENTQKKFLDESENIIDNKTVIKQISKLPDQFICGDRQTDSDSTENNSRENCLRVDSKTSVWEVLKQSDKTYAEVVAVNSTESHHHPVVREKHSSISITSNISVPPVRITTTVSETSHPVELADSEGFVEVKRRHRSRSRSFTKVSEEEKISSVEDMGKRKPKKRTDDETGSTESTQSIKQYEGSASSVASVSNSSEVPYASSSSYGDSRPASAMDADINEGETQNRETKTAKKKNKLKRKYSDDSDSSELRTICLPPTEGDVKTESSLNLQPFETRNISGDTEYPPDLPEIIHLEKSDDSDLNVLLDSQKSSDESTEIILEPVSIKDESIEEIRDILDGEPIKTSDAITDGDSDILSQSEMTKELPIDDEKMASEEEIEGETEKSALYSGGDPVISEEIIEGIFKEILNEETHEDSDPDVLSERSVRSKSSGIEMSNSEIALTEESAMRQAADTLEITANTSLQVDSLRTDGNLEDLIPNSIDEIENNELDMNVADNCQQQYNNMSCDLLHSSDSECQLPQDEFEEENESSIINESPSPLHKPDSVMNLYQRKIEIHDNTLNKTNTNDDENVILEEMISKESLDIFERRIENGNTPAEISGTDSKTNLAYFEDNSSSGTPTSTPIINLETQLSDILFNPEMKDIEVEYPVGDGVPSLTHSSGVSDKVILPINTEEETIEDQGLTEEVEGIDFIQLSTVVVTKSMIDNMVTRPEITMQTSSVNEMEDSSSRKLSEDEDAIQELEVYESTDSTVNTDEKGGTDQNVSAHEMINEEGAKSQEDTKKKKRGICSKIIQSLTRKSKEKESVDNKSGKKEKKKGKNKKLNTEENDKEKADKLSATSTKEATATFLNNEISSSGRISPSEKRLSLRSIFGIGKASKIEHEIPNKKSESHESIDINTVELVPSDPIDIEVMEKRVQKMVSVEKIKTDSDSMIGKNESKKSKKKVKDEKNRSDKKKTGIISSLVSKISGVLSPKKERDVEVNVLADNLACDGPFWLAKPIYDEAENQWHEDKARQGESEAGDSVNETYDNDDPDNGDDGSSEGGSTDHADDQSTRRNPEDGNCKMYSLPGRVAGWKDESTYLDPESLTSFSKNSDTKLDSENPNLESGNDFGFSSVSSNVSENDSPPTTNVPSLGPTEQPSPPSCESSVCDQQEKVIEAVVN